MSGNLLNMHIHKKIHNINFLFLIFYPWIYVWSERGPSQKHVDSREQVLTLWHWPPQSNLPSKSRSDSSDPWSPATSPSISGDTALDCLGTENSRGETTGFWIRSNTWMFRAILLYSCITLMHVKIPPCRCVFQEYNQTHQMSSFLQSPSSFDKLPRLPSYLYSRRKLPGRPVRPSHGISDTRHPVKKTFTTKWGVDLKRVR